MIEPWRKISSRPLADFRVFSVREDRKVSPRTGAELGFYVIDAANWVNVIALTPDERIVLVEQYRHGSNTVELEIQGGVIDAADASPEAAGCRELAEETGFVGEAPWIIGQVFPNPAIMSNTCYTVLVRNCRQVKPVHFDQAEDLAWDKRLRAYDGSTLQQQGHDEIAESVRMAQRNDGEIAVGGTKAHGADDLFAVRPQIGG